MKEIIHKYPIIAFYVCTLLFTMILGMGNMILFSSITNYLSFLPQLSPALATLIVVSIVKGKTGFSNIMQTTFFQWTHIRYYFIALITPIIICGIDYGILTYINICDFTKEHTYHLQEYFPHLLIIFIGCYAEEIGWRGFMLPQLREKYSLFFSSLLIGVFWGLWHLYFKNGFFVFILYMIMVIEISLIISWVCSKTKGFIMVAIIFHTSFNFFSMIFFDHILRSNSIDRKTIILLYGVYIILFIIPCLFIISNMLLRKYISNTDYSV